MEPKPRRGGLFGRANKISEKKSSASDGKGLLGKASKKTAKKAAAGKGLLARAGKLEKPAKGKGLLAQANKQKRRGKGLLAYADEIGAEDNNEEAQDLNINVAVVSPFSSMFSDLSEKGDSA